MTMAMAMASARNSNRFFGPAHLAHDQTTQLR